MRGKKELCLKIHRNAVHQSNLYLMHKLLWLDDNARGLHRQPDFPDGKYKHSVDTLKITILSKAMSRLTAPPRSRLHPMNT